MLHVAALGASDHVHIVPWASGVNVDLVHIGTARLAFRLFHRAIARRRFEFFSPGLTFEKSTRVLIQGH